MPGAGRTHSLVCKKVETHTSRQVRPKRSGIPCAMALRLLRALPGVPGFLVTVARGIFRELDSSVGESEPHGLTVRIAPHVLRRGRVHRIPHHDS
jgi:hypothetical protein